MMGGMRVISIKIKVFLLLLLISSVLIGVMALLMQRGVNSGFEQYKLSVERAFNHRVLKTLEWFYRKNHSWEQLRDNPQYWYHLLNRSGFKAAKDLPFKVGEVAIDELEDKERLRSFMPNYALFDSNKRLVVGALQQSDPPIQLMSGAVEHLTTSRLVQPVSAHRMEAGKQDPSMWPKGQSQVKILPLRHRQHTVGYLLSDGRQVATLTQDRKFNAHIRRQLLIMALAMLLLSTVLTIPITNYLSRPIEAVNQAVKRAALGDYSVTVEVNRNDEIGQMARNINRLNETLLSNVELQQTQMAEIAHELRTPIAVILAEIEAIQDGVHRADPKNIDLLHDQIFNLRNIVNDLYDLSISEPGALRYRMEQIDLLPLVEQILAAHKAAFEQRQLSVTLDCKEDGLEVYADRQRFRQLLNNILSNSIKYTAIGGELQLQLRQDDEFVEISIADSAPGVDEAQIEQIFQRFYRQAEQPERGSGLGLAIAKNIVKAHHGSIIAEKSELGGLVIHIKLPKIV